MRSFWPRLIPYLSSWAGKNVTDINKSLILSESVEKRLILCYILSVTKSHKGSDKNKEIAMNISAHINSLNSRKNEIEAEILFEMKRPMPDFIRLSELKRKKMAIKEEIKIFSEEIAYA